MRFERRSVHQKNICGGRETSWAMKCRGWKQLGLMGRLFDPKLLHAGPEGAGVQAQDRSCSVWTFDYPFGFFEDMVDMRMLDFLQGVKCEQGDTLWF